MNVRVFFDSGSHCSFVSPEVVTQLRLVLFKSVFVALATFGHQPKPEIYDLVKVTVRLGGFWTKITLVMHDGTAHQIFSPGVKTVANHLHKNDV